MNSRRFAAAALCLALTHAFVLPPAAAAAGGANIPEERRMWMTIGERRFSVTLADNEAARAFAALLPLTLDMPDLNGNEKHVKLPKVLPAKDLMLWGADTLVVFYLTFDSPYSYTRLGRIDDPATLPQVLSPGQVRAVFTRK
jgi:hypothetical protein